MVQLSNVFPITIALILGFVIGFLYRWILNQQNKRKNLQYQGSVLKGQISEQLAPYIGFPDDLYASESKFLGSPVDFIVFKGMNEKNISEVVFVEVKSGNHNLNNNESSLKNAIEQKRVSYKIVNIPKIK